jgi:hypothetical protein
LSFMVKCASPGCTKTVRRDNKSGLCFVCRYEGATTETAASSQVKLYTDLIADIRKAKPASYSPKHHGGKFLFEYSPFDLHLGKFAWGKETVTDYDVNIASDLFRQSVDYLLTNAMKLADGKLDRILFIVGNDVCHIDTKKGQTTAGTPMDVDTRYNRVFRRIHEIHREAIQKCVSVAPVDVIVIPGNHDEQTSFCVGEVLAANFESNKHVRFDNGPKLRKYYEYGVNMFGFAHGDSERVSELPLLMAREEPQMWARTKSRECHIGHLHISEKWEHRARIQQDLHSDKGVRVRRLMSMSAHDAWHTRHGYTDRRACDSFVFHKEAGFVGHLSFNIDHFTGKAIS